MTWAFRGQTGRGHASGVRAPKLGQVLSVAWGGRPWNAGPASGHRPFESHATKACCPREGHVTRRRVGAEGEGRMSENENYENENFESENIDDAMAATTRTNPCPKSKMTRASVP